MFFKKFISIVLLTIFTYGLAVAQASETETSEEQSCFYLLKGSQSIPQSLKTHLGDWNSCKRTRLETTEWGVEQSLIIHWTGVKLTVDFKAPEIAIYIVETEGDSPLTSEWYEEARDNLIPPYFEMNWDYDEFPGPTAAHYYSKVEGANGQFWVERNSKGAITWMRFSYAL